jgi:hypothetical protein
VHLLDARAGQPIEPAWIAGGAEERGIVDHQEVAVGDRADVELERVGPLREREVVRGQAVLRGVR